MEIKKEKGGKFYKYLIKKIDIYGEPLQWYIANNETYQTVSGGCRTIFVISISLIFLIYSIIKLFKDRDGSFVMYDITYPELDDADFVYFQDFEIFFFFKSSSSMMEMDTSIFQAYLTQINATDNSFMFQYPFDECDNDYFVEQLGFSDSVKGGLDKTYCINKTIYGSNDMTFSLAQTSPLGETTNAVQFILMQTCSGESCTDDENTKFEETISSIQDVKVFIKTITPNPLKMKNPLQNEVITFNLNSNFKGATVYFKNYNMSTQYALIPYIFGKNKTHFLAYDYYTENTDTSTSSSTSSILNSNINTYYLEFVLSSKVSFLEREYEQLDSTLGNFIGVFEGLQVVGTILTFIFDSFSKEFFIFNFILKDRLFIKKRKKNFISNPPPKINVSSNNELSIDKSKDKELLNIKENNEKSKDSSLSKNNYFTVDNYIDNNQKSQTGKESKNEMIYNELEKKNKNEIDKNEDGKEKEININIFKSFWCNVLMSFDIEKSKYPDIQNALDKIKIIQDIFDTSIYINLIFDMMRLKKVIFNQQQLKLFESIHFTFDEINDYLHKFNSCEEINSDKIINQSIERIKGKNQSKITENIISVLNEQINT